MAVNGINSFGAGNQSALFQMPSFEMSSEEKARLSMEVDGLNKKNFSEGRKPKQELGKDDFLQLLIAQLTHQDPTSPMEDTQFVAQMAQFTSLEQLANMNKSFEMLNQIAGDSSAVNVVGKHVDIEQAGGTVSGLITAATRGQNPQVQVNGKWYAWTDVQTVYADN
ncbi:MAG: flagellar hook assembly protein FlgD [Treponema sp.]